MSLFVKFFLHRIDPLFNLKMFKDKDLPQFEYKLFCNFIKNVANLAEKRAWRTLSTGKLVNDEFDHCLFFNSQVFCDLFCDPWSNNALNDTQIDQLLPINFHSEDLIPLSWKPHVEIFRLLDHFLLKAVLPLLKLLQFHPQFILTFWIVSSLD